MDLMTYSKRDFARLGWALLTMAAVGTGAQYLLSFLFSLAARVDPRLYSASWPMWVMTFVPIYLAAMPAGILLLRRIHRDECMRTPMPLGHFGILLLISFPILYGGNLLGTLLSLILSGGAAENALLEYVNDSPLLIGIMAVLIAPVAEEYLFRKQIIDRIGRYGEVTGILVSALTFALFHMNLFQFFYAFGLGILLAYAYTRTRMLRYSVALHMIINFMGSVLAPWILSLVDMGTLEAAASGTAAAKTLLAALPGMMVYMAYSALLMMLSVAGFVLLILRWKKRVLFPAPAELPAGCRAKTVLCSVGMILYILFCLCFTVLALL